MNLLLQILVSAQTLIFDDRADKVLLLDSFKKKLISFRPLSLSMGTLNGLFHHSSVNNVISRAVHNVSRTQPLAVIGLKATEDRLAVLGLRWQEGGGPPESCRPCQSHVGSGDHVGNEEFHLGTNNVR